MSFTRDFYGFDPDLRLTNLLLKESKNLVGKTGLIGTKSCHLNSRTGKKKTRTVNQPWQKLYTISANIRKLLDNRINKNINFNDAIAIKIAVNNLKNLFYTMINLHKSIKTIIE